MEQDELLKRVLMMQRLQGMESEPISAEDPYASMEKDQLISMIHFLVKREDERAQENQELKDMVKELRDTHKQDIKTQSNLMKSIDRLTKSPLWLYQSEGHKEEGCTCTGQRERQG